MTDPYYKKYLKYKNKYFDLKSKSKSKMKGGVEGYGIIAIALSILAMGGIGAGIYTHKIDDSITGNNYANQGAHDKAKAKAEEAEVKEEAAEAAVTEEEAEAEAEAGAEADYEEDEVMRAAFDAFDIDRDGFIAQADLTRALQLDGDKFSHEEIGEIIKKVNLKNDGKIDYQEFKKWMMRMDGEGSSKDLPLALKLIGFSNKEIDEVKELVDLNSDDKIVYQKLVQWMMRKDGKEELQWKAGDEVIYNPTGETVTIKSVHTDDPTNLYYTVQMSSGCERQTIEEKLTTLKEAPAENNEEEGSCSIDS